MSQIAKLFDGTTLSDVETLTGDTGGPVPVDAAHNINILGGVGIDVVGTPGTNTLTINDDDLVQGTGTTVGAVTADLITFPLGATAGVYIVDGRICGFNATDVAGGGYFFSGAARTTGAAGTEIAVQFSSDLEEAAMIAADIDFVVAANNIIVRATGIAGKTIRWSAEFEYQFVS